MAMTRKALPYLIVFAGCALLSHGLNMIYPPAWWIVTGILLIVVGLLHDWEKAA